MPVTKTLSQFQDKVVNVASLKGQVGTGSTFRHETLDLVDTLNSVYAEYRELLVERNFDFFLEETSQAAAPTTRADTNEQYALVDWPADAIVVKRVDVYQGSEWTSLKPIDWARIRDVVPRTAFNSQRRYEFFSVKSSGKASTTTLTAGKIALLPFSTQSGFYKISYLPRHTAISDTTHIFVFQSETGYMWCVWNAVSQIAIRDRDSGKRWDKAERNMALLAQRIGHFIPQTVATGSSQMRRQPGYNR